MRDVRELLHKNIFAVLYILVYIAIMFSGNTWIKQYVPNLFIIAIMLLAIMTFTIQGRNSAFCNKYKSTVFPFLIIILFVVFLLWQYPRAYVPTIVMVYIRRYFIMAFFFIFIPNLEICHNAIKVSKHYSFIVGISIIVFTLVNGSKSGGFVGDFQSGGMMMSIASIMFLIDYFNNQKSRYDMIGLFISIVGLLISGKRMFSIIVLIAFLIIFMVSDDHRKYRKFITGLLMIGVVLIISVNFIPAAREVMNRVISLAGDTRSVTSGRNVLWEKALIAFNQNRLTGIGFGAFQTYFGDNYHIAGISAFLTHNIYIGLLAETGIVGFVIFVGFMLWCLKNTWKIRNTVRSVRNDKITYVYTYSLLLQLWFIIYGFTGNGIYDANEVFFYFTAIAMMIMCKHTVKQELTKGQEKS